MPVEAGAARHIESRPRRRQAGLTGPLRRRPSPTQRCRDAGRGNTLLQAAVREKGVGGVNDVRGRVRHPSSEKGRRGGPFRHPWVRRCSMHGDVNAPGLGGGGLRQRQGEHAIDMLRFYFFSVDVLGQAERADEFSAATFATEVASICA